MVDQTLRCRECGVDFIWTAGEQEFYASRGLSNAPSRCPSCRQARKAAGLNGSPDRGYSDRPPRPMGASRPMHETTCASCGGIARVPFIPRGDKPVYCSDCFRAGVR